MFNKLLEGVAVTMFSVGLLLVGVGVGAINFTNEEKEAFKVLQNLKNQTVFLRVCGPKLCTTGTGIAVKTDENGSYILSNKHVCLRAKMTKADHDQTSGVNTFYPVAITKESGVKDYGTVVRVGTNEDLCLIRTKLQFSKPVKFAKSYKIKDQIITYGYPQGVPTTNYGEILGSDLIGVSYSLKLSAKTWYGASGSGVVNKKGELVGLCRAIYLNQKKEVVFSVGVPLETIKEFVGGL
jgi:hypothetical protein